MVLSTLLQISTYCIFMKIKLFYSAAIRISPKIGQMKQFFKTKNEQLMNVTITESYQEILFSFVLLPLQKSNKENSAVNFIYLLSVI